MNSLPGFLDAPLNLEDPRARAFLDNVQGNILKAHSRNYVAAVFLAFNTNRQAARDWIAGPLLGRVFSAIGQQADIARWKASARVDTPFAAFLLSFPGYFRLDIPDAAIPKDPYFRVGMKASPAGAPDVVADPSVDKWEPPFQQRIDALVLLADGNAARLDATVDEVLAELRPLTEQTFVERGRKLLFDFGDRKGVEIENFGHQDGISLPQLIKQDAEKKSRTEGATIGILRRRCRSPLPRSPIRTQVMAVTSCFGNWSSASNRSTTRATGWPRLSASIPNLRRRSRSGAIATVDR